MVDNAHPGATISVPPGIYRESIVINKPLVLVGQPGAEIRGSDVWSSWRRQGRYWVGGTVPSLPTGNWPCMSGSDGRCRWPEQVFFDGKPLRQVAGSPRSGQFALDSDRRVLLADNPAGHTIEVTTRSFWIKAASEGVTVQGFTMRHAASPAQRGAIDVRGYANWTIRGNVLSDVHGTVVYIDGPSNVNLLDNDISRGGQQGVNGSGDGTLIRGNRIYDNNTEGFDPAWEAGGLKITRARNLIIDGNEAFNNDGPGLWCDIDCDGAVFTNNRAHHNARQGIAYEISHGGTIAGNAVWENGWGFSDWGWGAGILCNTCDSTEIRDNIAAWNADGIVVIAQDRADGGAVVNTYVHDNLIVATDLPDNRYGRFGLAWLTDFPSDVDTPAANNRGERNAYYYPTPEAGFMRFGWPGLETDSLDRFNTTPGEHDGRYVTADEADSRLAERGIPTEPEER